MAQFQNTTDLGRIIVCCLLDAQLTVMYMYLADALFLILVAPDSRPRPFQTDQQLIANALNPLTPTVPIWIQL